MDDDGKTSQNPWRKEASDTTRRRSEFLTQSVWSENSREHSHHASQPQGHRLFAAGGEGGEAETYRLGLREKDNGLLYSTLCILSRVLRSNLKL